MSFLGKVVLITGSSSGIGAATAHRLAKQGAALALSGRNVENLKAVAKDVGADKAFIVPGDVTKEADTESILKKTIEKYGKLDVLINNAGILETGSIENTSLEQFDRLMNTNIRSIYHLTMLAVQFLIKTQGNIVNVSSVNGIRSFPGLFFCWTVHFILFHIFNILHFFIYHKKCLWNNFVQTETFNFTRYLNRCSSI